VRSVCRMSMAGVIVSLLVRTAAVAQEGAVITVARGHHRAGASPIWDPGGQIEPGVGLHGRAGLCHVCSSGASTEAP